MNKQSLLLSPKDFLEMVKSDIEINYQNQKIFAESIGLSQAYVSDILRGRREPGKRFLQAVKARRVVSYEVIRECTE